MTKPRHPALFDLRPPLDPTPALKRALKAALGRSELSRDQVADRMNELAEAEGLGRRITKPILDGWTKPGSERLPGPVWLLFLCHVLNDFTPVKALAEVAGLQVIGPRDQALLAWARAEESKRRADRRARAALLSLENEKP